MKAIVLGLLLAVAPACRMVPGARPHRYLRSEIVHVTPVEQAGTEDEIELNATSRHQLMVELRNLPPSVEVVPISTEPPQD